MGYKQLFVWVEGPDDERFFEKIIKPILEKKYNWVKIISYANLKREKIDKFLKSIKERNDAYIYARDINDSPCVTAKKQKMRYKLNNIDEDRIIVVIKEIESWYLAGLDSVNARKLGITHSGTTDDIAKEYLNRFVTKKFDSRIDFLLEILKRFSIETAKQKNKSFRYFLERHDC